MKIQNLDQLAAKYAQKIVIEGIKVHEASVVENLITKTLGVLQEQGVYACMLFLFSRTSKEKEVAPKIREQLYGVLGELPAFENKKSDIPQANADTRTALPFYSNEICGKLPTLLLVKELYEQTLIYARYGAKAEKEQVAEKKQA